MRVMDYRNIRYAIKCEDEYICDARRYSKCINRAEMMMLRPYYELGVKTHKEYPSKDVACLIRFAFGGPRLYGSFDIFPCCKIIGDTTSSVSLRFGRVVL